jgi:ATP-dependent DNA helicase RecG
MRNIRPGKVAVVAIVEAINVRRSAKQRRFTITEAVITDGTGTIKAVWFNQPYLSTTLKKDTKYLFAGNFEFKNNYLSLSSPSFEPADSSNYKGAIYPIYPETASVSSKIFQKLVAQVIDMTDQIPDDLPEPVRQQASVIGLSQALKNLHQPETMAQINQAKERLGFEELFWLMLTGMVLKAEIQTEKSFEIPFNLNVVEEILNQLNFELTDAQRKSAWAILQDIEKPQPMNRMLEGDVGSGKTLVALLALAMAAKSGHQAALMVPTEILARQHMVTVSKLLKALNIKTSLLISALPAAEKKLVHTSIAKGKTDVVIGTHALLSEGVEFKNLALIIIDEQHRFGVNQRRQLKTKASAMPHVLTMTATPIPRSLSLVVYGDLDISIIDSKPTGRLPITTKVVSEIDRNAIYQTVNSLINQGQQVYIVCPAIEENDFTGLKSVEAEYKKLQKSVFRSRRIAMLHGKMKADEKEQIMEDFRAGKYDILLATTVIEVGVDVPNATVLMVENAERFGLATLHQLRGRVGRSDLQSYCYLFSDNQGPDAFKRLKALEKTNDGFRLAQIDLEMRGPGEIYGTAQAGILDLRFADLFDAPALSKAKEVARDFLASGEMVQYKGVLDKVNTLKKLTSLD